ncbi:hypothetical protein [Streptomyces griseosporeus]|uniref:hypothetical protein n=1 Tax=Streptomyces griseosporeus TaxID=1910 RepID=UPI00167E6F57|nr:hypothetical protein [Streptomyces griseosporeus]GHF92039.1 hypothetical protein GCM10018783_73580 [Streptomyces griseosporeus]
MPEPPTSNYGLAKPEPTDSMSAVDTWFNPNWDKIVDIPAPPSGTTLPSSGSYNIGDRFYKSDTQSIYLLVVKDANWGWHWRPIHDGISPWKVVPTTCLNDGTWSLNPTGSNPFAIAYDNKGKVFWRGVIGPTSGNFARNTSLPVLKPLPQGLLPRQKAVFMLGHEPISVGTDGTNTNSYQGARIYIPENTTENPTVRGFGGTADFNRIYLGGIQYAAGTGKYTDP